jgi:predicted Zn-dependent protease
MNEPIQVEATAAHPELEPGQGAGHIDVDSEGLSYTPRPSNDPLLRLPLEGLELRLGGASKRLIIISHSDHPDWHLSTPDKKLIRHPAWAGHPAVKALRERIEFRYKMRGAGLLAAALLLILSCMGIWAGMDPASRWVAQKIPPETEAALGESAYEQILAEKHVIDDPLVVAELNRLAEPLILAIDSDRYSFKFTIIEDESINAFALPGGYMAIHTGLILKADRAEEVLGVMAHELAHVTEQHSVRVLIKQLGLQLMVSIMFGDMSSAANVLLDNAPALLQLKFSRDHETEADTVGFHFLERANIDPHGMIDFFKKIKAEHEDEGVALDGNLSILSTHPATDDRIGNLEELIENESHGGPYKYMDLNFRSFQDMLRAQLDSPE